MNRTLAVLLSGALALVVGAASAAPHATPSRTLRTPALSVGSPTEGHLQGGVRLEESRSLRFVPDHHHRWGLAQLVGMLERSAAQVRKRFPGSILAVGDLSRRGGGDVAGHHSHESGRDADVGFYVTNSAGKSLYPGRFVAFDEQGRAPGGLRFDDARNWALVEAWLRDPQARVTHIFLAEHLRKRLLDHARARKVPLALRTRAAFALMQPSRGLPHDNHFHVRIACPPAQRGVCVEQAATARREPPRREPARREATATARRNGSKPTIARARKRVGTTGDAPPALVAVVPAPRDID
ncbi:MAG: penicillin-insensitive murein endopeptidase [Polyangiaceae bacterium]|nr:penicillin-insensitive murein endopeptidase [Polyangiaceae bacterium]